MQMIRISSRWTIFYKFVLPAVFLFIWVDMLVTEIKTGTAADDLPLLLLSALSLGIFFGLVLRLKRIDVDEIDGRIDVSNYLTKSIAIPLSEIATVREFKFTHPWLITIYLKKGSDSGQRIFFLAGGWPLKPHTIAAELRRQVKLKLKNKSRQA